MGNYAKALSSLLVIVFLTTLKVEARVNPQVKQPSFKPTSEIKNIKKDSSETNAFSRDSDDRSTVPQSYKEKDGKDFFNPTDASANAGFENKFFNGKEGRNSYNTYNNDRKYVYPKEARLICGYTWENERVIAAAKSPMMSYDLQKILNIIIHGALDIYYDSSKIIHMFRYHTRN